MMATPCFATYENEALKAPSFATHQKLGAAGGGSGGSSSSSGGGGGVGGSSSSGGGGSGGGGGSSSSGGGGGGGGSSSSGDGGGDGGGGGGGSSNSGGAVAVAPSVQRSLPSGAVTSLADFQGPPDAEAAGGHGLGRVHGNGCAHGPPSASTVGGGGGAAPPSAAKRERPLEALPEKGPGGGKPTLQLDDAFLEMFESLSDGDPDSAMKMPNVSYVDTNGAPVAAFLRALEDSDALSDDGRAWEAAVGRLEADGLARGDAEAAHAAACGKLYTPAPHRRTLLTYALYRRASAVASAEVTALSPEEGPPDALVMPPLTAAIGHALAPVHPLPALFIPTTFFSRVKWSANDLVEVLHEFWESAPAPAPAPAPQRAPRRAAPAGGSGTVNVIISLGSTSDCALGAGGDEEEEEEEEEEGEGGMGGGRGAAPAAECGANAFRSACDIEMMKDDLSTVFTVAMGNVMYSLTIGEGVDSDGATASLVNEGALLLLLLAALPSPLREFAAALARASAGFIARDSTRAPAALAANLVAALLSQSRFGTAGDAGARLHPTERLFSLMPLERLGVHIGAPEAHLGGNGALVHRTPVPRPPPPGCALAALLAEFTARAPAAGAGVAADHLSWLAVATREAGCAISMTPEEDSADFFFDLMNEMNEAIGVACVGVGGVGGGGGGGGGVAFASLAPLFAAAAAPGAGAKEALARLSAELNRVHCVYNLPPPALAEHGLPMELLTLFAEHSEVWDAVEGAGVRFLGPGWTRETVQLLLEKQFT
jgi:hypothetical protein